MIECVLRAGARLAQPGEFTRRAYLNGRIDLAQAEAVIETIKAKTVAGLRVANAQLRGKLSGEILGVKEILLGVLAEIEAHIDFPDEDLGDGDLYNTRRELERSSEWLANLIASFEEGRVLRDGVIVAIVGRTNVGKSSLLNRLLGEERAIVTAAPGTTRDIIEETVTVSGLRIRVVDTAGIRRWRNIVEREGIKRTERTIREADMVLLVVDRSRHLNGEDERIFKLLEKKRVMVVVNKSDLPPKLEKKELEAVFPTAGVAEISARTGEGVERLRGKLYEATVKGGLVGLGEQTMVIDIRHRHALEEAREAVEKAKEGVGQGGSPEIVALEVRCALDKVGEVVGEAVSEDILDRIFSRFCVGK